MLTVRLPKDLEFHLSKLAEALDEQKSKIVIQALRQYIEDKSDYLLASKIYKKKNKTYTHEEMLRELNL